MDVTLRTKKEWLRPADLVSEFGLSRTTIYAWAGAGVFGVAWQPNGPGSSLLFHRSEVIKAIERAREALSEKEGTLPVDLKKPSDLSSLSGAAWSVLET